MDGYIRNENLFAINYPNVDFNWKNADILKWYIEEHLKEIKDIYPTIQAYSNRDLRVDLVGHSNGGLVSRYYIENLNGSRYVRKLITMNTPHWGSGFANVPAAFSLISAPLDLDLAPNSMQFGGPINFSFISAPLDYLPIFSSVREKRKYINRYQTHELKYNEAKQTNYYFIAGYDEADDNIFEYYPEEYRYKTLIFPLIMGRIAGEIISFEDLREGIQDSFYREYFELWNVVPLNFNKTAGDNVVNIQSQLGFHKDKELYAVNRTILINTFPFNSLFFHFHSEAPKRLETINQVIDYLNGNWNPCYYDSSTSNIHNCKFK